MFTKLLNKIKNKKSKVGIVGVGYVGEALGKAVAAAGFEIIGFEKDEYRINYLNSNLPANFRVVGNKNLLTECDVVCICVPTPLTQNGAPDYSILTTAVSEVAANLRKGQLISTESSVSPGTSLNLILPILSTRGLKVDEDYYLAYSPERVDPGNRQYEVKNIPKVVSGMGPNSLKAAKLFYGSFIEKTVAVSSPAAAELTKVLENVFRLINISLVNEIADYARVSDINIWEVINAAATKPFGFLPHYPGPGAGGYCIPVLPEFLLEDARKKGVDLKLVATAANSNKKQPEKVAKMAINIMNGKIKEKETNGELPQALLVGIGYKDGLGDTRESTAVKIWEKLKEEGVKVHYHDPHVPKYKDENSRELDGTFLEKMDVIILTTAHEKISYETLLSANKPLLDTRNALNKYKRDNIHHL